MSTRPSFPMLFLLISMMLWIPLDSATTHVLHRGNSSSSGPLLTSSYMKQAPATHPSHSLVTSILQLINILQWQEVIVLSDRLYYEKPGVLISDLRLKSLHYFDDIDSSVETKQLLQQLHTQFFPKLHFILLSNYSTALRLFQMVEQMDVESNRTTDFRHYSFWLVACFDSCSPSTDTLPHIKQMENVALVSFQNELPVLCRLLTAPNGRMFSTWKYLQEIKVEDDVFPNKKYGLNNRTLIVSLLVSEPYIIKTKKGFEGHYIDLFDSIASSMNFSYETVHSEDIKWGKLVNGRWDGLVGQLERREVDLVLTTLTINEDREKVMDFLYPPIRSNADHIMYRLHSEDTGSWKISMNPFKPVVLVVLLVILAMFTIIVGAVFLFEGGIFRRTIRSPALICKHRLSMLADVLFYVIGILLNRGLTGVFIQSRVEIRLHHDCVCKPNGEHIQTHRGTHYKNMQRQGVETNPSIQSTRVLLFTWGVFSVIIAACYSANLVASFTVQKPDLPFTSLGELVRQKEYKWGYISGAIREHIFNLSRTGDMRLVWEGVQEWYNTDPEILSDKYSVHIRKVMTEKYAFILHSDAIQRLRSKDCRIRYVDQNIIWHHTGIGVPTNYPPKKEIEYTLSRIVDSGLLDIWWRRWGGTREDQCAPEDTVKPLTLPNTVSAFYLLCVGLGAAFVALVMEVIKYKQPMC